MGSSAPYRIVEGQRGKCTRMLPSASVVQCLSWAVDGYFSGQEVPFWGTCHNLVQKSPCMNAILSQVHLFHIITISLRYFYLSMCSCLRSSVVFQACLSCPSVLRVVLNRFCLIRWLCVSHLTQSQHIESRDRSSLSWFCRWPHKPWQACSWRFLLL
jgi:hypothetical protein